MGKQPGSGKTVKRLVVVGALALMYVIVKVGIDVVPRLLFVPPPALTQDEKQGMQMIAVGIQQAIGPIGGLDFNYDHSTHVETMTIYDSKASDLSPEERERAVRKITEVWLRHVQEVDPELKTVAIQ